MAVEIDKLDLDITIKQKKDSANRVRDLANAISRLNTVINKIDNSKMSSTFSTITKGVGLLTSKIRQANKELTSLVRNNVQDSNIQLKNIGTIEVENPNKNKSQSGEVGKVQGKATQLDTTDTTNETNSTAKNFSEITNKTQLWQEQLKLVEENLKNANLTQEQYLSLQSKKITLTERIEREKEKLQEQERKEQERIAKEQERAEREKEKLQEQEKKEQERIAKEEEKSTKSNKRSLADIFKRVLLYRIIRGIIQRIASSLKEGFDLMAKKSKDFNQGFSELTSSIKIIVSSAALIVGSFLPIANSILKPIASIIAIIANFISRISASLQGQTKYLKVNLEYFKDYKSQMQGSLLAFDTFTTLNATPNDIFQEENIENGKGFLETISSIREEFEKLPTIIKDLIIGLTILGSIKLVKWIMDGSLKKALSKTFTTSNLGIAILTAGILLLVEGIKQLVDNWNNVNFSGWEKAVTIVTSLVAGIVAAVVAIKAFHMPVTAALGIGAGLVGGILLLGTQLAKLTAFADGGMFEGAGTMYALAGESGAEIVAKGSQGTGVTNIAQFRQAMVEALYEYGASRGNLDNIKIQMNNTQVGKMVARSSYDEMKRQGLL